MRLRADDRVLLLDIPSNAELEAMARVLSEGVLVAMGSAEEVDRARAGLPEFENVLFLSAQPDQIPWRDRYFTKVIVPPHLLSVLRSSATELARVLAENGEILSNTAEA